MSDARGAATAGEASVRLPMPGPDEPPGPVDDGGPVVVPPAQPSPPGVGAPPLDASVHAHVLEDPLPPPEVVDSADTPLFVGIAASVTSEQGSGPASLWTPGPVPAFDGTSATEVARHAHHSAGHGPARRRRIWRRILAVLLTLLMAAVTALAVYLLVSARAWRDRSGEYLATSLDLGANLSSTRSELAWAQAELEAVRAQLDTAHSRIIELANEKNQIGDEWEITQQLVDYQERVSDAAGEVALALDQCVQGQQQLIGYLQASAEPEGPVYDPVQLGQFEAQVDDLCRAASQANITLQEELAK